MRWLGRKLRHLKYWYDTEFGKGTRWNAPAAPPGVRFIDEVWAEDTAMRINSMRRLISQGPYYPHRRRLKWWHRRYCLPCIEGQTRRAEAMKMGPTLMFKSLLGPDITRYSKTPRGFQDE